jgi:eukaryotic-like serine/threonine-protein kinase
MASQRELVKTLFGAALDLRPEERASFLDTACGNDSDLRRELEALLAAHEDAGSFLERPIIPRPDDLFPDGESIEAAQPDTIIGPYRLLELIGEGGMGQVWLAEQKQPVRRRVAIKLIKAGMDTREVVARFESERQALALMDHPAIAKVFDAGSTSNGRPYFVMEYVAGIPITTYCDRHRLTLRQRMELFIQVCEGVHHAHQKSIIHRDLKPSNILVAEIDGKARPRIIDFGVAKATTQKLTEATFYTHVGMLLGTLGYMSPEQADPTREDIDSRADVYSLGVVLFELLTGALPFDLSKLPYDQALRRVREEDAPRPSTRLGTLGTGSGVAADNRGSEPAALVRQLRGDPDAIALKALEKQRSRRYASAADLAADIVRYLHNEPVTAHPPNISYRTRKYLKRHPLEIAVGVILVLLLVLFVTWWRTPETVPTVEAVTQLTDDGNPKVLHSSVVSDGSHLYFGELQGSSEVLARIPAGGGQTEVIPTSIEGAFLMDLAPDASSLLIGSAYNPGLYLMPLPAGEPRKLTGFEDIWMGRFSSQGGFYLAKGRSLYAGDASGETVRKLVDLPNVANAPASSPDGKILRAAIESGAPRRSLWEMNSDGSGAHPLLPEWQSSADTCCGRWTADGKYFVFQSRTQGRTDLWVLPERTGWFAGASVPLRLTHGPLSYENPFPSADGKHLYAIGIKNHGELVRYDPKSGLFVPYLSGISAADVTLSSDGKWAAYMSYPDHNLWRVRADGSERQQLTFPPVAVRYPRISPDGTKVAYGDANSRAAYVISIDGGTPRKVADRAMTASWSPDSKSLLILIRDATVQGDAVLETLDLRTGKVSMIPDYGDKRGGFWAAPDRLVSLGARNGLSTFYSFDLRTKLWSPFASAPNVAHWVKSIDDKYLYYMTGGDDPEVLRVRFSDGAVEKITSLKDFRTVEDEELGSWIGITADGDPVFTRDIGTQEIYDLSVKWP